jgi:hypothetical protein
MARLNLDAALLQRGDEGDVAAQAVELGDEQLGSRDLCSVHRGRKLRPRVELAAFDLDELGDGLAADDLEISRYRFALRPCLSVETRR